MRFIAILAAFLMFALSPVLAANPLPVDDAFRLSVVKDADNQLLLNWQISDGYYLYRDHIEAKDAKGAALTVDTQPGIAKDDPNFGRLEVYYTRASASVPAGREPIQLTYQGCQEDGICYRPETRTIDPVTLAVSSQMGIAFTNGSVFTAASTPAAESKAFALAPEKGMIENLLDQGGSALVIAAFLALGVLLAFTPCVFPIYPIVAGTLAREGEKLTAKRGFVLSSTYVFSLALGFAAVGAIAGWSGQNLQMVLQSKWMALALAGIFTLLALSMFGLFQLQLPSSWVSVISAKTGQRTGSKRSAAILGFSSVLIVGPCVTAPLAGALLYIAQTANVALGASALFALGIGKGLPLIAFATLGAGTLPRAGAWMEAVKQVFGFGFLATAIFMAAPLLPSGVDMVLWALLLFGVASFAFLKIPDRSVVVRTIGTAAFVYGVILMLGVASGGRDPLQPLAALVNRDVNHNLAELRFAPVETVSALQEKLDAARGDQPTLVYFTADWCVSCSTVERRVLPDAGVKKALGGYQLIKADVSDLNAGNADLMAKLKVAGPPTMVFFNNASKEPEGTRLVGDVSSATIERSVGLINAGQKQGF
ncbi:protein-disulfide reductase DsbD [Brucella pseudogrignonensis]|uniref:protein-disulfide reductase DsbD n=1 Tax=Brucella pseudogrignonensis TaxID=419475 RepID=UPI0019095FC9|nr:protein-disulfide reductase DsbD [Brucella pseudogrignonensis]MBK0020349.1 protein-disulfide reductase DsbD [Ochrobactrum sp. S45]MBK0042911.1 protein-disulfide reductase DsbD [Ochrobactrum sp. S46]UKK91928.1 protein-disulfide reductase DsbD [Brucella pseudogrignonensis]